MKCVALLLAGLHIASAFSFPNGGAQFKKEGPCWDAASPDAWPVKEEARFCGSDGILYPSKSAYECLKNPNSQVKEHEKPNCTNSVLKFDPCISLAYVAQRKVCGSDNVTYTNIWDMVCTLNTHKVEIKMQHEGECDIECPYSPIYKPVCSANNFTFANEEALQCRRILKPYSKTELKHSGRCKNFVTNPCHETSTFTPACASNGRTYSNAQHVRCLKASNPDLKVLHDGACTIEEVTERVGLDRVCDMAKDRYEWTPVCSNTNVTYLNAYTFLCAAKENKDLKVDYKGECGAFNYCREPVPAEPKEVCGNNGVTYPHENALYCAQATDRNINRKHDGPCDESADDVCKSRGAFYSPTAFLDDGGNPVCGSDGVTYAFAEALWCAAKSKSDLKFIHPGACF